MLRYRIIHPVAHMLCVLAMKLDITWLYNVSGELECYADECAWRARNPRR